ncbi:MAG: hypothetical protein Q9166_005931 [cf. Caloplaca sp. 2 TL-2023]
MAKLTWLVTGILARGDNVIATARKADQRPAHLKDMGAAVLDLDMCAPEAELQAKAQDALKIFTTNFFGVTHLTRAVLPHMREKPSGTILINGSMCGWQSLPCCPGYNATKYALEAYTENLQFELVPFNIRSIIFEAGHFRTGIISETNRKENFLNDKDHQAMGDLLRANFKDNDGNQPGDTRKGH